MIKSICVFCASSSKLENKYLQAASLFADICAENRIHILFGGGATGLMGVIADRMLEKHGKITGIIPSFMKAKGWNHEDVEDMIVVENMRERKRRMIENVDAVVALPGGVGTLEELLEVITLKQLGQFTKPIVIINTNGFYNSLLMLFDEMAQQNFIKDSHREIWTVIESAEMLLEATSRAAGWDESAIDNAAI